MSETMTTAKEVFLSKSELRNVAAAFINHEQFQEFLIYTRAHMMESYELSAEQQIGVRHFCDSMFDIIKTEPTPRPMPGPGLKHDLDMPQDRSKAKKRKTTKQKG